MKPYGVCYRLCESDEARVPYVYHTFRFISEIEDFWNYALNTSKMDRQLKKIVSSGARMDGLLNIGYDAYMSVRVMVPALPEQQKIADFLSTIDTIIEKQRAMVSAWEERKKGVMQKLFSQEVRFKADDGSDFPDWEEKKMTDLFTRIVEKNRTDLPALTIIQGQGTVRRDESDRRISYDSKGLKNYKVVRKDNFIVHLRSFEGGLEIANQDGIVSPVEIKKGSAPKDAVKNFSVLNPIEEEAASEDVFSGTAHLKTKVGTGAVVCMPPDLIPVDRKNWYVPAWII